MSQGPNSGWCSNFHEDSEQQAMLACGGDRSDVEYRVLTNDVQSVPFKNSSSEEKYIIAVLPIVMMTSFDHGMIATHRC